MKNFKYLIFLLSFGAATGFSANIKITVKNHTAYDLLAYNKFTKESVLLSKSGAGGYLVVAKGDQGQPLFLIGRSVHDKVDIVFGYYRFKIWRELDLDLSCCQESCNLIFNPATLKLEKMPGHDEKEAEIDPLVDDTLKMWPIIVRFANEGKKDVSISFGEQNIAIAPKNDLSMFISKIDEVSRVKFEGFRLSFSDLLSKCAGLSSDDLSVCTYDISNQSIAAKIENFDLKPFFSSKQELLESFQTFEKQVHISHKVPTIIEQVIAKLPIWQEKGSIETEPLLAKLDKFEAITKHTKASTFFWTLKLIFEIQLKERNSLFAAVELNNWEVIGRAMQAGADVEQTQPHDGKNVLHIAAEFGWKDIVQWLLKDFSKLLNSLDHNGHTPLYLALDAMPYELEYEPDERKIADQHSTIKLLFSNGGNLRIVEEEEDEKAANPLAAIKIGNNLGSADIPMMYGPQNIYEDLGKKAIWSLSQAMAKKRPWALKFSEALDFIALNRRLVAYLHKSHVTHLMGRRRVNGENDIVTPMSKGRQGSDAYARKMFARLKDKTYHNSDDFFVFEGPYEELPFDRRALKPKLQNLFSANVCHQKPLEKELLRLSSFDIGDENVAAVRHTSHKDLAAAMKEMTSIFNHIIEDPYAGLDSIARMHWWLAQTTPHVRGGGAIAEWMAIALMFYKGIDFRGWAPQVETWAEAITYSEREFVEKYLEFLQK